MTSERDRTFLTAMLPPKHWAAFSCRQHTAVQHSCPAGVSVQSASLLGQVSLQGHKKMGTRVQRGQLTLSSEKASRYINCQGSRRFHEAAAPPQSCLMPKESSTRSPSALQKQARSNTTTGCSEMSTVQDKQMPTPGC